VHPALRNGGKILLLIVYRTGFFEAGIDGRLSHFALEVIVAAIQDLGTDTDKAVRNALAEHLNRDAYTRLRRSISLHTFPASRSAAANWSRQVALDSENFEEMPAYQALKDAGMDPCGLAQLASCTVGVPFVGLIAGCLVIAELLRRLHGGFALEFASGSVAALEDSECGSLRAPPYTCGHVPVASQAA
jgi:hypothetical protein